MTPSPSVKSVAATPRYGSNKRPVRDTAKLAQRVRQLESQRVREEKISKHREDEITDAKFKLLTEKEKEKRSEGKEREMVHRPAVAVSQETQTEETEVPLGPAEDTRAEVAEKAASLTSGCGSPPSLFPCSPIVSSESREQGAVASPAKKLGPSLLPRPIREPQKPLSRATTATAPAENKPTAAVDAHAVVKLLCALASALASLPLARGLAPPSRSPTPNSTFVMDPFLKWNDHDPSEVGGGLLSMM